MFAGRFEVLPDKFNDVEQSQVIGNALYAGELRIPPAQFLPRSRREVSTRDAVNANWVETWVAKTPQQQNDYYRADLPGGAFITGQPKRVSSDWAIVGMRVRAIDGAFQSKEGTIQQLTPDGKLAYVELDGVRGLQQVAVQSLTQADEFDYSKTDSRIPLALAPVAQDMMPLSSRTDPRDFRQSQPFDPRGESLALNPYFDRYDPTRDPRNAVRELRSVVYEVKEADRGQQESALVRERVFANRYTPEGSTPTRLVEAYELMRPKIDNPEIVYRGQSDLWKYGSPYGAGGGTGDGGGAGPGASGAPSA
jgi:hypothetical protein